MAAVPAFLLAMLGPWLWFAAAFALLALAVLRPARIIVALALGAMAAGTSVITLQFTDAPLTGAASQALLFAGSCVLAWQLLRVHAKG